MRWAKIGPVCSVGWRWQLRAHDTPTTTSWSSCRPRWSQRGDAFGRHACTPLCCFWLPLAATPEAPAALPRPGPDPAPTRCAPVESDLMRCDEMTARRWSFRSARPSNECDATRTRPAAGTLHALHSRKGRPRTNNTPRDKNAPTFWGRDLTTQTALCCSSLPPPPLSKATKKRRYACPCWRVSCSSPARLLGGLRHCKRGEDRA